MNKKLIGTTILTVVFLGGGLVGTSAAWTHKSEIRSGSIAVEHRRESQFPDLAKIDAAQAIKAALTRTNGKMLGVRLEDENGFLVYGVKVVTPDKSIVDVKVDAGSGAVLAMNRDWRNHHERYDRDRARHGEGGERE
jgi:LPS sulfotransferase NodH